jgi:hypothetical protein
MLIMMNHLHRKTLPEDVFEDASILQVKVLSRRKYQINLCKLSAYWKEK